MAPSYSINYTEEDPTATYGPHGGFKETGGTTLYPCFIYDTIFYDPLLA